MQVCVERNASPLSCGFLPEQKKHPPALIVHAVHERRCAGVLTALCSCLQTSTSLMHEKCVQKTHLSCLVRAGCIAGVHSNDDEVTVTATFPKLAFLQPFMQKFRKSYNYVRQLHVWAGVSHMQNWRPQIYGFTRNMRKH